MIVIILPTVLCTSCKKDEETDNPSGEAPDEFTDNRDGQIYKWVKIGNQTWMAENLNYETTNSSWFEYSSTYGDIYGRLYALDAALTACPSGWHLPTDDEWKQMEIELGISQSEAEDINWRGTDEGKKMKSTNRWNNNGNGTNSSGFNALPGGYRASGGLFFNLGNNGIWWTSSSSDDSDTWALVRKLDYNHAQVYRIYSYATQRFSVRCLKN